MTAALAKMQAPKHKVAKISSWNFEPEMRFEILQADVRREVERRIYAIQPGLRIDEWESNSSR